MKLRQDPEPKNFLLFCSKYKRGGIGQCKGIYSNKNNRARRYDAEPMIPKGMNMALRFVSDRHNRKRKTNRFVRKIEICLFNFL